MPALNEEDAVGDVDRRVAGLRPGDRGPRDRRRLDRPHGARRQAARRARRPAALQPRHRRGDADRLPVRASSTASTRRFRSTATGSTIPPSCRSGSCRSRGQADIVVGSRFAGERSYRAPIFRRIGHRALRADRLAHRAPASHRHDLRLPRHEPARDRALRGRLPARLPRGRGDRDGRRATGYACWRCPSRCASRRRPLVDHGLPVRLLHGQGAARDLRRPLPSQRRPAEGGPIDPLVVSIAGAIASIVLLAVVFELIRSRRLREQYALLWLLTGFVLLVLSALARRPEHDRRLGRHHRLPAGRLLRRRAPVHDRRAAALLDRDLEARRPEHVLAQRLALLESALRERDELEP